MNNAAETNSLLRANCLDSTSVNLLERLKQADTGTAWVRFVELYVPLIFYWARQHGLNAEDAADLVQDVLVTLVTKLPSFEYNPDMRFRGWLQTITLNRARDWERRRKLRPTTSQSSFMERLPQAESSDLFDESEYQAFLVQRARTLIMSEFEPVTWEACWRYVTDGSSAEEIARELGISANAVRIAKCRVLRRLRQELAGLLD